MAKAVIIRPTKPEDFPALAARVDGLLQLWNADFRTMPLDALTALRDAGRAALASGESDGLARILRERADDHDIGLALMNLIGSFVQGKEQDLTVFGANLTLDVKQAAPGRVALEATCAHLRKTRDFTPSIKAVLETLAEKTTAVDSRAALLEKLEQRVALAGTVLDARRA